MPPKKKGSSLGRAVMRNRFGPDQSRRGGEGWVCTFDFVPMILVICASSTNFVYTFLFNGGIVKLHTTDIADDPEGRGLSSVTETGDLEEFLTTAEMSGREFVGGIRRFPSCS